MKKKQKEITLDEAPLKKFHIKLAVLTFGAHFTDGYVLGIISFAITLLTPQMHLGSIWLGLLGSSALIGLFFGSLLLGWLSDYIGRQKIFLVSFVFITVASFLQFFAHNPTELFIYRVLIGFGLGGDYSVGQAMIAEFSPRRHRGFLLGTFNLFFTIGLVVSSIVGIILLDNGPDAWRWMLASSTIPAAIVLIMRFGTPESPRYLLSKGKVEEAEEIVKEHIGDNVVLEEVDPTKEKPGFSALFSKQFIGATVFNSVFYACIVLPYFAINTFLPTVLSYMGLKESNVTDIVLNLFLLIGVFIGMWMTNKLPRRKALISLFIICTIALGVLGVTPSSIAALLIAAFIVYALTISALNNFVGIMPAESFPTDLRASGVGFATAISRIGSAAGTFFLPLMLTHLGKTPSMLILTAVLLLGTIVTIVLAPETKSLDLNELGE